MNSTILLAKINKLIKNGAGGLEALEGILNNKVGKEEFSKELAKKANASSLAGKADKTHKHAIAEIDGLQELTASEIDSIIQDALNR